MKKEMKTRFIVLAIVGTLFTTGLAIAASTTTDMNVTANITAPLPFCNVSATAPYFNITVSSGSGFPNGTITVNCAQGTLYHVAMDRGENYNEVTGERRVINGSDFLVYFLYQDAAFTTEWGDNGFGNTYLAGESLSREGTGAESVTVYGNLVGTPTTGPYTDNVRVSVHF